MARFRVPFFGPCFGTAPGAQTVRCISSWPFSGPESGLCFGAAGELQNMTRRWRRAVLSNMLYFKSNACGAHMTLAWILEGWNPLFQNVSQNSRKPANNSRTQGGNGLTQNGNSPTKNGDNLTQSGNSFTQGGKGATKAVITSPRAVIASPRAVIAPPGAVTTSPKAVVDPLT